ncbi:MAG: hypothetical protein JST86_08945 [Bacteroidetes bacterium]|nr:hypothetical protein [Bacteroidota bacterium]
MNKIVLLFEAPGMSTQQYDAIMDELHAGHHLPNKNLYSHTAYQNGNTCCVVDVWQSEAAAMDFAKTALFPIFEKLGLHVPPPKIFAVHNYMGSTVPEHA